MLAVFVPVPLVLLPLLSVPVQPPCAIAPVAPTTIEAPILASFNSRVDAYMQLHNDVEKTLPAQWLFEDAEDMFEAVESMRSGIRAARPDARRGSIFTADVTALIRTRLEARLAECKQHVEEVLAFINEERLARTPKPQLHEPFPWALGSAMPAALLPALPPLPDELQYRFADRDLVLIDMHADVVVDILVNALPAPSHAEHGTRRH